MNESREKLEQRLRTAEGDRDWASQYGDEKLRYEANVQILEASLKLRALSKVEAF